MSNNKKEKKNNENNIKKPNKTKSTNIKKILKERDDNVNINNDNLPLEELNLTLENLENLELETKDYGNNNNSSSINEIQQNFLKKKMEDEVSDPGSDIDLEQFENSIING